MILYDSPMPAPNPRRVRMFAAEKGIALATQTVSIVAREHKSPAFLAINPRGQTPALKLDDGTVLTESVSICRYLEAIQPDPPLFGTDPVEIAQIDMWIRRTELILGAAVSAIWVNVHPFTAKVVPERFADYGESNRPKVTAAMAMCNEALAKTPNIAGKRFSVADIILLTTVDFAGFIGLPIPLEMRHLLDWHARISARPSAQA
jgi:glutathione S-transferase